MSAVSNPSSRNKEVNPMRHCGAAKRSLKLASMLLVLQGIIAAQQATPAPVKLTDADNNRLVEVVVGQRILIWLPANPTTGYSWLLQGFPNCLELMNFSYARSEKDLPGAGTTQVVELIGYSSGTATLTLEYRRPWEKNVSPAKTFSVAINVVSK